MIITSPPIEIYGNIVYATTVSRVLGSFDHHVETDGDTISLIYEYTPTQDPWYAPMLKRLGQPLNPFTLAAYFSNYRNEMVNVTADGVDITTLSTAMLVSSMIGIIPECSQPNSAKMWIKKLANSPQLDDPEELDRIYRDMFEYPRSSGERYRTLAVTLGLWQPCPFEYLV
jgi:hypothetical protein